MKNVKWFIGFAAFVLCAITVLAGSSGVTNGVTKATPEYQMFKERQIEFNDDVVSALDTQKTLSPGKIEIGNATSNASEQTLSGVIGVSTSGVTSFQNGSLAPGYIFVGNASSNAVAVLPSGSVSVTTAGAFSMVNGKTTNFNVMTSGSTTSTLYFSVGILTNKTDL